MTDYLEVLALGLLPAGGTLVGTALAEWRNVSPRSVGMALHAAAGVAIAVVSIELLPPAISVTPPWMLVAAFCLGAALSIMLARGVGQLKRLTGAGSAGAWMVYLAVAADLLSDGLMIGIGSAVSGQLGLLLGLSQVVANVPGGFAAVANFRNQRMQRSVRILAAASLIVPVVVGATAGYWLLRDTGVDVKRAALVFVAGVLLLATVEDVVPQADEPDARRWLTTTWFTVGFASFALLALYVD